MRGMKWFDEMRHDIVGIRFAFNVAIATTIVWYVMDHVANTDPIWAIASMVAASDPQVTQATRMFRSRMINVTVGCVVSTVPPCHVMRGLEPPPEGRASPFMN